LIVDGVVIASQAMINKNIFDKNEINKLFYLFKIIIKLILSSVLLYHWFPINGWRLSLTKTIGCGSSAINRKALNNG